MLWLSEAGAARLLLIRYAATDRCDCINASQPRPTFAYQGIHADGRCANVADEIVCSQ